MFCKGWSVKFYIVLLLEGYMPRIEVENKDKAKSCLEEKKVVNMQKTDINHSTVTDLAKFLGKSTSIPLLTANQ